VRAPSTKEILVRCTRDIYLASTAVVLPPPFAVSRAIAEGLVDAEHSDLGYESILISQDKAPPEMAVDAARQAVSRSGLPAADFGALLHGSLWFQGLDMWACASYIANEAVGPHVFAIDVQQRSNAGMGALHLAVAYLEAGFSNAALVTTADRFAPPVLDRWNTQANLIFADGGSAVALSTSPGVARVLASTALAENTLEPAGRGSEPFGTAPGQDVPVGIMRRLMQFASTPAAIGAWERYEATLLKVRDQVLADAGLRIEDISRAVLPFIHRGGDRAENYDVLGFTEKQSLWELGRLTGHMGGGDQVAGLNFLLETQAVGLGDVVLLLGVGVGHSFTASLVEITQIPAW
jgi:3-oxoacyl-[acyl-carrier-protein] synthase III